MTHLHAEVICPSRRVDMGRAVLFDSESETRLA